MRSMKEYNHCPKIIQEIAQKLTKKTLLERLDWTKSCHPGDESFREKIKLPQGDFWINIGKREGIVYLSFSCNGISPIGSLEYYDGMEQDAIQKLFAAISNPDETNKKREMLEHREDVFLAEALLKWLR